MRLTALPDDKWPVEITQDKCVATIHHSDDVPTVAHVSKDHVYYQAYLDRGQVQANGDIVWSSGIVFIWQEHPPTTTTTLAPTQTPMLASTLTPMLASTLTNTTTLAMLLVSAAEHSEAPTTHSSSWFEVGGSGFWLSILLVVAVGICCGATCWVWRHVGGPSPVNQANIASSVPAGMIVAPGTVVTPQVQDDQVYGMPAVADLAWDKADGDLPLKPPGIAVQGYPVCWAGPAIPGVVAAAKGKEWEMEDV